MLPTRLSLVLPVRNGQSHLTKKLTGLLEELTDLLGHEIEIILVDDGSQDGTPEVLDELCLRFPQLRQVRHPRPLGFEAAGQTGLRSARHDLVIIAEDDRPIELSRLKQLLMISNDHTVVAAKARSEPTQLSNSLLRRLRSWGAATTQTTLSTSDPRGLQLIRRPHLDFLASSAGQGAELSTEQVCLVATY